MSLTKIEKREKQILKAATDLFVQYGYDKTTVSDIAKAAGVSKGMIYLHFESKQALFEKLIVQEMQMHGPTWLKMMDDDPDGGTIAGIYRGTLRAMNSSPFMQAVFKQDGRVFGSYLKQPDNIYRRLDEQQIESHRLVLVRRLQEAGAMRGDISASVIGRILAIIAYGLPTIGGTLGNKDAPSIEELIEGIAVVLDKALTPDDGGNPTATKQIVREMTEERYEQFAALLRNEETHNNDTA